MPSDRDDAPSTRRRLRQEGKARQQASPRIVDPRIGSLRPDYGRQLRYRPPGGADKPWTPIWILRLRYSRLGELVLAPVQAFLARIGINRLMRGIFDVVIIIMSEFYAPILMFVGLAYLVTPLWVASWFYPIPRAPGYWVLSAVWIGGCIGLAWYVISRRAKISAFYDDQFRRRPIRRRRTARGLGLLLIFLVADQESDSSDDIEL